MIIENFYNFCNKIFKFLIEIITSDDNLLDLYFQYSNQNQSGFKRVVIVCKISSQVSSPLRFSEVARLRNSVTRIIFGILNCNPQSFLCLPQNLHWLEVSHKFF